MLDEYSPNDAVEMVKRGEAVIIDVREKDENASERIEGAINLPLSSFSLSSVPPQNGRVFIFQCVSGMRSARAASMCASGGISNVANLAGGIMAWKAAGLSTIKG